MDSAAALKRFELENNVKEIDDALYAFKVEEDRELQKSKPWTRNPRLFTKVRLSVIALIKMMMHAKSGGDLEVMGLMQGRVAGSIMIVLDAFALPVEGSETRVSAGAEAMEYAVALVEDNAKIGRMENIIGWYHSHPGYGCWLSGIDVGTQHNNQMYQDPFLAIVVDPHRSMASGKVDIGAFRTLPAASEKESTKGSSSVRPTVPLSKIADFGTHADQYYSLPITLVKSSFDSQLLNVLWNQYWTATLKSITCLSNRDFLANQISDFAEKLDQRHLNLSGKQILGEYAAFAKSSTNSNGMGKDKLIAAEYSNTPQSPESSLQSSPVSNLPDYLRLAQGELSSYAENMNQISAESANSYLSLKLKLDVFSKT